MKTIAAIIAEIETKNAGNGYTYTAEKGRRYTKVVGTCGNERTAVCFVDNVTGLAYEADSWSKPSRRVF